MISLIKLWIVTYKSDFKLKKARFSVYDDNGEVVYKIITHDGKEIEVTKEEGNEYYKELMEKYQGKVNKVL